MTNPSFIKDLIPDTYQTVFDLSVLAEAAGISKLQQGLIKLRISQMIGSASCVRSHQDEVLKYEQNSKRLTMLETWRNVQDWFSPKEQLLLSLTEEITQLSDEGISVETYGAAIFHFGEEMTAKLIIAVIDINAMYSLENNQNTGNLGHFD